MAKSTGQEEARSLRSPGRLTCLSIAEENHLRTELGLPLLSAPDLRSGEHLAVQTRSEAVPGEALRLTAALARAWTRALQVAYLSPDDPAWLSVWRTWRASPTGQIVNPDAPDILEGLKRVAARLKNDDELKPALVLRELLAFGRAQSLLARASADELPLLARAYRDFVALRRASLANSDSTDFIRASAPPNPEAARD